MNESGEVLHKLVSCSTLFRYVPRSCEKWLLASLCVSVHPRGTAHFCRWTCMKT